MARILITRPVASAQGLAAALRSSGYDVLIEPLLTILPTGCDRPQASAPDAVMLTSANALAFFDKEKTDWSSLLAVPCFCVGGRTAEVARKAGFNVVATGSGDGVSLRRMLETEIKQSQRILHICGVHTSGPEQQELGTGGLIVDVWKTYRAEAQTVLSSELKQALVHEDLAAALFFSPRTAEIFVELVASEGMTACCAAMEGVGLSQAVADKLQKISWRRIRVAPDLSQVAMIHCLEGLKP